MADVLANLKTGNLEEVPDVDSAISAGTHGVPVVGQNGDTQIAPNLQAASCMVAHQGFRQPNTEELRHGLLHAAVDTPMEKLGSTLEGAACGASSIYTGPIPVFQGLETSLGNAFGIKELSPEMVNARHSFNSGYEGVGQVGGAIGATIFGGEETAAVNLPRMAEAKIAQQFGGQLPKLGSMAAKAAVTQAIFSGNQELGKFFYDPDQTMEKAVMNTTLNTAIGGIAGAALGTIPALWEKTSNAVNTSKTLQGIKNRANVTPSGGNVPDDLTTAGFPVTTATKAAASSDPIVRQTGINLGGGDAIKGGTPRAMVTALGADPETDLAAVRANGASEIASPLREAVASNAETRYNAAAKGWDDLGETLKKTIVPPEAGTAFGEAANSFQEGFSKGEGVYPEWNIIEKYKPLLPKLQTLEDYQDWRSRVGSELATSNGVKPGSYGRFIQGMDAWQNNYLSAAGEGLGVPAQKLSEMRSAWGSMKNYLGEVSTALKIKPPEGRATIPDWLEHLRNPLALNDNTFLNKTVQGDNDALLDFFKKNIPESVPSLQAAFRQQAIQKAMSGGEFKPDTMWNYIQNNWSNATQQAVMGEQGVKSMATVKDLWDAQKGLSKSGGFFEKVLRHFYGGVGMMAAHAAAGPLGMVAANAGGIGKLADMVTAKSLVGARLAFLKFLENGIPDVPAFKAASDYFSHSVEGHLIMQKAVESILEKGGMPETLPKQAQPDQKGADKLSALMDKYNSEPGSMMGIGLGLSPYLPDHQMALANLAGRAQQYLQNLKPTTEPLGPLDGARTPTAEESSRYNRALNLVNKPLSILHHIAKGNVTQDDMAALELYPKLQDELSQHIMGGIASMQSKGKTVPYKQRLALSTFLGSNLDSTIGPMTMMTLQSMQKPPMGPPGQPGRGGKPHGGAKKPPQGAFSKMQEGAAQNMTMAQKAESDRVGQP